MAIEMTITQARSRLGDGVDMARVQHQAVYLTRDRLVVNTGPIAYRRADGIGVVPLALLGP